MFEVEGLSRAVTSSSDTHGRQALVRARSVPQCCCAIYHDCALSIHGSHHTRAPHLTPLQCLMAHWGGRVLCRCFVCRANNGGDSKMIGRSK